MAAAFIRRNNKEEFSAQENTGSNWSSTIGPCSSGGGGGREGGGRELSWLFSDQQQWNTKKRRRRRNVGRCCSGRRPTPRRPKIRRPSRRALTAGRSSRPLNSNSSKTSLPVSLFSFLFHLVYISSCICICCIDDYDVQFPVSLNGSCDKNWLICWFIHISIVTNHYISVVNDWSYVLMLPKQKIPKCQLRWKNNQRRLTINKNNIVNSIKLFITCGFIWSCHHHQ